MLQRDLATMHASLPPPLDTTEYRECSITDEEAVAAAVGSCELVVNCAVIRAQTQLAFDVNVRGTFHAISSAVAGGHRRFINTGPSGTVVGPSYRVFRDVNEEVPPWPGTGLYYMTKGLGHELTRIFANNHDIHVLTCLFGGVNTAAEPPEGREGAGAGGWATTLRDCGQVRARWCVCSAGSQRCCSLSAAGAAPLRGGRSGVGEQSFSTLSCGFTLRFLSCVFPLCSQLPSRHETFFIAAPTPQRMLGLGKATRLLGWQPQDRLLGWVHRL